MSMCLYIARGAEAELRELAEDAEALSEMTLGSMGGGGPFAALAQMMTPEKLAQIEAMVAQQPQLRQALDQIKSMVGPRGASPFVAGAAAGGGSAGLGGLGAIFGGMAGRAAPRRAAQPDRPPIVDLHKSWHMFHFLFTGHASGGSPPGSLLMEGGEEVGEDMGYGPARLIGPADTAAFANFVGALSVDELKARLDGPRMAALSVYPAFEAVDAVEEYADDVEHYFPKLRDHLAAAAAAREAVLVWLS